MSLSPTGPAAGRPADPDPVLEPPALQAHLVADDSFAARFLRCLAAIAASDRVVNLAEYEALGAVVERLQHSALAARLVLAVSEPPHAPDRIRCETLEAQGFRVLIFGRRELLQGFDAVAARIAAALDGEEAVS